MLIHLRNSVLLTFILLLLSGCGSSRQSSKQASKLIDYAGQFVGTKYKYGGDTPKGFDCSGYTSYVFRHFGYELPRSSSAQANTGVGVSRKKLKTGDLVFFTGSNAKSRSVGHVGIVIEADKKGNFIFIHASTTKGVTIDSSKQRYYKDRFLFARRVMP